MKKSLLLTTVMLIIAYSATSQITKFRKYGIEQGICNKQIYDINQDKRGFVWLGTGDGLCKYDGFDFSSQNPDTNELGAVRAIFKDGKENLWIGYQNGLIFKYDGTNFKKVVNDEENKNLVVSFALIKGDVAAFTQNNGMILFKENGKKEFYKETYNQFYITTTYNIDDEKLITGSFEGLSVLNIKDPAAPTVLYSVKELDYIKIQNINHLKDNEYLVGTEGLGLYKLKVENDGYKIENWGERWKINNENIQSIFIDNQKDIWLCTFGSGIIRLLYNKETGACETLKRYNSANGLGSSDIKKVFQDSEGNFWVGTYNDGLACLTDEGFQFNEFQDQLIDKNITAIASFQNYTWYGSANGVLRSEAGINAKYSFFRLNITNDYVTSLFYDGKYLWIGTFQSGLFRKTLNGNVELFNLDNNSISKSISFITGSKDALWVATKNGVYLLENNYIKNTNFGTNNGLPHNNINSIYLDNDNNAWISTKSSGLCYVNNELQIGFIYTGMQEIEYKGICKDSVGDIWAATAGYGVIKFSNDSILSFTIRDGLKSNYCYSIQMDDNQNLWIGHRLGISKIKTENNSIKVFGTDQGILGDCNSNASIMDSKGDLVFGTTNGIIIYNQKKEKEKFQAPKINFAGVRIYDGETEKEYSFDDDIVLPYKKYRIRIEFIGLSYKAPETVKYQYKLEGFDTEWSELTGSRLASYGRVTDGHYVFKVKACNSESLCNEIPLSLRIKINKPFWKTVWFISLVIIIVVAGIIIIIKMREKQAKALQEYLQRKLDERTKEVVKQKEEIELKNRDITDSINYAQRIQASILPSIKQLQNFFTGSFVFYQPRDIVSGDFYWFGLTKNNKFVIVCADSTGHGVPGAFMSMIGTILIKDICAREEVVKPSDILFRLDNELSNTLNQNIEAERSNDGMDIIVCEIDIKTYYARIASAMRPVIVYQNGQQIYVKGSRNSVGGHVQKEEKIFENEGFQLSKGDLVYMFSDGYPDQFGGPMEKKFKMVRLKNLIKDMHQKPMDEQYSNVKDTFNLWKEGLEQVDDVLFMGIKI